MRMTGWCERCHRMGSVRVTRPRPGAIQNGTCRRCEDKEQERTKEGGMK
jgi:hypothetical protein